MRFFVLGVVTTILVAVICVLLIVRAGYINFNADQAPSKLEMKIGMKASDASVERRATNMTNPLQATDDTLMAGARLYRNNCSVCHGDPAHMDAPLGDSFNPPAPQFMMDAPDMPEYQNYYIVRHGIRWTGMPSWKTKMNETQSWQVVTLLSHLDKLPSAVSDEMSKPPSPTE
jgi:thiosulfate dehydrogenase